MACQEHVEILLKGGTTAWNKWRATSHAIPDLRGADLSQMNLCKIRFDGANLSNAVLDDADLRKANLSRSYMFSAHLIGAQLRGARLNDADLSDANLVSADLTGTHLVGTNLTFTDLQNARLSFSELQEANFNHTNLRTTQFWNARMGRTCLGNVDLSSAIGLETVNHNGSSLISTDTIYRSLGRIPATFLHGAGVPADMIAFIESLARRNAQSHSCVISSSSKDSLFVRMLHEALEQRYIHCWFAPSDLKIGDKFRHEINRKIRLLDKMLLVLSVRSIKSWWVEDEVEAALEEEGRRGQTMIFPIRIDNAVMKSTKDWAVKIRERHIGDFTRWKEPSEFQKALEFLLRDLRAEPKEK